MSIADTPQRTRPAQRFAGAEHFIDLPGVITRLRAEKHPGGHQQEAIYKSGPVTVAVFVFDAGGHLREHRADGLVTIQLLDGSLLLHTPEHTYDLVPGGLVTLAPGVPHSIQAHKPGAMLLTICRNTGAPENGSRPNLK